MSADTFNKIAGATLAAFLVLLLLNFVAGKIYGVGEGGHHGDEPLAFALEIESEEEESAGHGEEAEPVDYAALLATADAAAGEKTFKKCKACHKVAEGANATGPTLWGVVGRDIASIEGFKYSRVMSDAEGDWTLQALGNFLENPKKFLPDNKMSFKGIKDPQERVNLIVYLNEADGSPEPLE